MDKDKVFILVDGSSYLYRAFYALPELCTKDGLQTGAIKGVTSMLRKLVGDYSPDLVAVVFDARGKTFRDDLYPEYKANRPPMPDEMRAQIEPLHDLVRAMGLPLLSVTGVEADDVIGTLAVQAAEAGQKVLISTGDKDMAQLVNDKITLINTMSGALMDPQGVVEKFGVRADQIIDYLALVGDTSDNIPGVPKCGPKTAARWLAEFGSMDGIIQNADAVKGKVGGYLRDSISFLPLSHQLATIRLDVDLDSTYDQLALDEPFRDDLIELLTRLEFNTWLRELREGETGAGNIGSDKAAPVEQVPEAVDPGGIAVDYHTVLNGSELNRWIEKLTAAGEFAFDTETTGLDYMQAKIVGVSFACTPGEAAYVPVAHRYEGAPAQLGRDFVLQKLSPLLASTEIKKIGQNLKYDRSVLLNHGIELNGIEHDTMLESFVLDSTAGRHDMDSLAERHLGLKTVRFEDIAGKGKNQLTFDQIEIGVAAHYAAEDADITLRLHRAIWPRLVAIESLRNLYREIELPLVAVLSRVERNGVKIDPDMLFAQSHEIAERLDQLEREAHEEAGEPFNLGSPKQIQEIFFEKKKLPIIRKTPKGQPSTAEDVLEILAIDHRLPRLILEHRGLSKLKSTYTDKLPLQIDPGTGRVHTSYHQAGAATGRFSSTDPNLQNIPVRSGEGRRIRQAFIAEKGNKLLAADYSQIELRIMAHLSGDEGLRGAFDKGLDIHNATAAEVFGVPADAVEADQRRAAKAINFGLIYGMSAFGLARQLQVSRGEAQDYINLYFSRYPGVKRYMEQTRDSAREKGYVETVFGRRLYLPEIDARNAQRRQYAERTAINAPMQGTAADIIKRAMCSVDEWLQRDAIDARLIMQVHDELVLEVSDAAVPLVIDEIKVLMVGAAKLNVPLDVDVGIGDNWEEAH